jgi:biotin operon repressor
MWGNGAIDRRPYDGVMPADAKLPFDPIERAGEIWSRRIGDPTSMRLATSIMRVQQILMARLNEILGQFELTFPRYEALMLLYLSSRGSLPLGKIGERLQVHRTSVTNLVDGLERSGFAENFDAVSGAGLRDRAYTWTASVYLMLRAGDRRASTGAITRNE